MNNKISWFEKLSKPTRKVWIALKAARSDEWMDYDEWLEKEYDEVRIYKNKLRETIEISRPTYNNSIKELTKLGAIEILDEYPPNSKRAAYRVYC